MNRYVVAVALVATLFMVAGSQAADITMTWDGGAGFYNDANWNGGDTPSTVIPGQDADRGWDGGKGPIKDPLVVIDGAGSDVIYDAEFNGDYQWHDNDNATSSGELQVSGGATFTLQSDSGDDDGVWTQTDTGRVTVTGAGSLIKREQLNSTLNGGAWAFGSWQNQPTEGIFLDVLDGGTVENQGQMWFGAYGDSEIDLDVIWTVGEKATINAFGALENGISNDDSAGSGNEGSIDYVYNYDSAAGATDDSEYAIDMTGHGGRVIVDSYGIRVQEQIDALGNWTSTVATYEDLYAADRLRSDGSNAAAFGDKFTTVNSSGVDDYTLISIEGAVDGGSHPGDISGDCLTNAIDFGTLAANFGGGALTVSEGNLNGSLDVDAADAGVMFAAWTGDPGPAPAGSAAAEYDPNTGEVVVSVAGVVNWYVQSASLGLTGDPAANLPQAGGAVSDNNEIVGETTGFISMTYTDVSLGNIGAYNLPAGDLTVSWNTSLGGALETIPVDYLPLVPEPSALALAAIGLCGMLATRRRRMA